MSTFIEADHPRQTDGKFTDKPQSAPELSLTAPSAEDFLIPRDEDYDRARAELRIEERNKAFPDRISDEEADARISADELEHLAARIARDEAPARRFEAGVAHEDDDLFEAIWDGSASGFSEAKIREEIALLAALRTALENRQIGPAKIIGTGYKNPRKQAFEYLDRSQAEYQRALETRGRNLIVNVSNVAARARARARARA